MANHGPQRDRPPGHLPDAALRSRPTTRHSHRARRHRGSAATGARATANLARPARRSECSTSAMSLNREQPGLAWVTEFRIPESVLLPTLGILQKAGKEGHEAFVVWGARPGPTPNALTFATALRPAQRAVSTPEGLLVIVDGEALFETNRLLYERQQILAAQVHSHPTEAYHSDTDDALPLVTLIGGLSIVIPDFAQDGNASLDRWAWYRLESLGRWAPVDANTSITLVP